MHRFPHRLWLAAALMVRGTAGFADTYPEAEQESQAAPDNPALLDWCQNRMQPAFRNVLGAAAGRCLASGALERPDRVDLVSIVQASGKLGEIFWKKRNAFAASLQEGSRPAVFPLPPQRDFRFGVGFCMPPRRSG
jgi:hypothetical protein